MLTDGERLIERGPLGNRNRRRQFGHGALLDPSPTRGQLKARLIDTSSEKQDDALAQAVTITCGQSDASDPNLPIATRMYRLEGILKWGSDGAQHEARFDWAEGTIVRPVGGAFVVDCELLPAWGETAVGINARVHVAAHAGYESASLKPALLTRYGVDVGGAGVVFPVPAFANGVTLYPSLGTMTWVDATGALVVPVLANALRNGYGQGTVPNVYGIRNVPLVAGTPMLCVWQLTL